MKKIFLFSLMSVFLIWCSNSANILSGESETVNSSERETRTILALWDSLTAWFGLDISDSYPSKLEAVMIQDGYDYDIINGWVSWDTSQNLLDRAEFYLDQNPDIVLLVIGWNDGLRSLPTDTLEKNIQSIIDIYEWKAKIVLWGMEIPAILWLNYARDFKKVYFNIADDNSEVYFFESFLEGVGGYTRYNQADRIHPTSEWYDIIVENFYEFLKKEDIITK